MIVLISDLTKLIKNNTAGISHPGGVFISSPLRRNAVARFVTY